MRQISHRLVSFLRTARDHAGWRFLVLWVGATNLGFFPGLWIGEWLSSQVARHVVLAEPIPSAIVGATFAFLVGSLQWLVLRRHLDRIGWWVIASAGGWTVGVVISGFVLPAIFPSIVVGGGPWIVMVGFLAGAAAGIPQWRVLRRSRRNVGGWWIAVSALGWGIYLPGIVTGLVLARLIATAQRERTLARSLGKNATAELTNGTIHPARAGGYPFLARSQRGIESTVGATIPKRNEL